MQLPGWERTVDLGVALVAGCVTCCSAEVEPTTGTQSSGGLSAVARPPSWLVQTFQEASQDVEMIVEETLLRAGYLGDGQPLRGRGVIGAFDHGQLW